MSERLDFKGDYMGFTYNGKHSSELGIVRVSDGSRFNENLLPTMQDKTVQVPGGDGTYYFGSYYTQRQFNISFAFDDLTEEQIARIKRVFGDKGVHDLIFDEAPYKVYSAKVTGTATIKYIPFAEGSTNRLYKGEGSVQFTCYNPFARCAFAGNSIKENLRSDYPNIDEWWDASRIGSDTNFGDVAVPFTLIIDTENGNTSDNKISWKDFPTTYEKDQITYSARGVLNTRIGVVMQEYEIASNEWKQTGVVLNNYFSGDLISKIPVGQSGPVGAQFTCLYY